MGQSAEVGVAPPTQSEQVDSSKFLRRLFRHKLAVVCVAYLCLVVLVAIVAPLLFPSVSSEQAGDLSIVRQGPSSAHWLGTDTLGRDVFQRLLVGTRITVVGVLEALIVIVAAGVPLGLLAGYFGGRLDRYIMWIADVVFSIPAVIVVIMVLSVFRYSMLAGMIAYGLLVMPILVRVVRSAVLPVRQELYVTAARVSGLSHLSIIRRHILPRVAGPITVQTSLLAASVLLAQSGLSFLGLLVKAPAPSWGGMVADGVKVIVLQPWLIWPPGVAIALSILALGLLGDLVRDAMTEAWASPVNRRSERKGVRRTSTPIERLPGSLLEIEDLKVAFRSPEGTIAEVVQDVGFAIGAGETVGIVGESGCGKTATAMAILGLLPSGGQILSGSIAFESQELTSLSERELHRIRGKAIGLVSQEPMVGLNPTFRIGWQIAEVIRRHRGSSRAQARREALELLGQVNLPDPELVAQRYPHEVSGGMAQRVSIARALAGEPRLLIADEPTTALDVTVQAEILELLRKLQRDTGMAILLITHDWGVVADICDRAVVLYAGQVVESAPVVAIFNEPRHPYTKALIAANPHSANDSPVLPTIPGSVPRPGAWPTGCHFHPRCEYATAACRAELVDLTQWDEGHTTRCLHSDELELVR
jgi:peptide/nickel transport system permease protein